MPAVFLTIVDLQSRIGAAKVNSYFDDSYNGGLSEESSQVQDVLMGAESLFFAPMLRAFPGNPQDVDHPLRSLVANDPALLMHVAWVGCELAAERRPEFCSAEGWGPYKVQYERAIAHFDQLSKGLIKSSGGTQAGTGATSGGKLQPRDSNGNVVGFTFAPDGNNPQGHGGF